MGIQWVCFLFKWILMVISLANYEQIWTTNGLSSVYLSIHLLIRRVNNLSNQPSSRRYSRNMCLPIYSIPPKSMLSSYLSRSSVHIAIYVCVLSFFSIISLSLYMCGLSIHQQINQSISLSIYLSVNSLSLSLTHLTHFLISILSYPATV